MTFTDKASLNSKAKHSLLPPNATQQEKQIALAASRISNLAVPIKHLWDPLKCSGAFITLVSMGIIG